MLKQYWKITLLVLLFLPVLVSLGFWQIERAQEKEQALVVYQQRQELPVLPWFEVIKESPNTDHASYRKVLVEGVFDQNHYWLLDNQPRMGKPGYEVVMPMRTERGTVFVNRGWLKASPRREELPSFDTPNGPVKITGYLYPSQKNAVLKQTESDLNIDWPRRVLQLDLAKESKTLHHLYNSDKEQKNFNESLLVRITENNPGALITEWPVINTKPEKHTAYAVQWFSMAGALLLLFTWYIYREQKNTH